MTGDILAFVHPARLAACCHTDRTVACLHEMAAHPRFTTRVDRLVRDRLGVDRLIGDMAFADAADARIAALALEDVSALSLRCGAVLWAKPIMREIRGPVIAAITDRLGTVALALARRHPALGCDGTLPEDMDVLEARLLADGHACIAAWLNEQPQQTRDVLRLKWPGDDAVPATTDVEILSRGGAILRRVVADLEDAA